MIQGFTSGLLGNRELIYETDLPSFQRDFASLKTLDHGYGPNITFTRASNATFFDVNGVLQTASNDVPRFDHNPSTGASLGLLIEEARTNSIRNSQAGGAVVGTPGTAPTNWGLAFSSHNITSQIVNTGTENGLTYVDIRYFGTPNSGGSIFPGVEANAQVSASNGQTWTFSSYVKLSGGTLSNVIVRLYVSARDSGGLDLADNTSTTITPTTASLATQRSSATRTFNNASAARAAGFFEIAYTSGNPIDITLRIAAPQLEQGAFATSYIPTTTAAATRAADFARVTPISSFYNQAEGAMFAELSRFQNSTNSKAMLFLDDATPARYIGLESTADGTGARFIVQNNAGSTVAGLSFASPSPNVVYKQIGTYKENDFIAAQGGTLTSADTSGTPTDSLDRLGIGCLPGVGNFPLNGHIRKIAYWPKRLSNALLQQLTT